MEAYLMLFQLFNDVHKLRAKEGLRMVSFQSQGFALFWGSKYRFCSVPCSMPCFYGALPGMLGIGLG